MKGKSKRYPTGSMEYENWRQFKAFLRQDNRESKGFGEEVAIIQGRIAESVAPMREHAALVESNKQNEYAARLWKAHAEEGIHLTDVELAYLVQGLACLVRHMRTAQAVGIADLLLKLWAEQGKRQG